MDLSNACIRTLEGVILFWCQGNEKLYGWSRQEAVGHTTHLLLKTKFPKPLSEIEADLLAYGSWKGELLHRTKSGVEIWVASHWIMQRNPDGSAGAVVEINNDITGTKRSEEKTRGLASIIESSDDAIISKTLDGIITSWNPGAERLFGYSSHEIIGKTILTLFPPELAEEEINILARLHRGERIQHYETVRMTKSGKRVPVSLTVSPLFNAAGKVIGASKIARDISQRKNLERAFQESERQQMLAVEAGEIGLWSYDTALQFAYMSPRCKIIWGLPHNAPTPPYEESLRAIHADDVERVDRAFQSTIMEGTPFDVDFRILQPGGAMRWVQAKGRPWTNPNGRVTQICGALVDFTHRKKTEEALRRTNGQLEQFAYAAAHDLQEPLRNVALSIELAQAQMGTPISKETEELLRHAVQSAHQMQAMVRDLLVYSRSLYDSSDSTATDANEVLDLALNSLAAQIRKASASITQDELPMVRIDKAHLLKIFQNIIGNALNYRSEQAIQIHVAATAKQNYWQLSIRDNGIGIDPQYHQRVFGVFKRLHGNKLPGTGVGLALCKRIVEYYGGEIGIRSDGKQGSTFFFTVPAAERSRRAASAK